MYWNKNIPELSVTTFLKISQNNIYIKQIIC